MNTPFNICVTIRSTFVERMLVKCWNHLNEPLWDTFNQSIDDQREQFTILKKCSGKLDYLTYEMFLSKDKKPKLNTQSDTIKAKLFTS